MATLTRTVPYAMGLDWNDSQTPANNLPNAALASLLTALVTLGLITDTTT